MVDILMFISLMFVIPVLCVVMFGNVFDRLFSILKQPTSLEGEGLSLDELNTQNA